jgi:hypothetical protein
MPPSILNAIEGGGQCTGDSLTICVELNACTADRFPYAGITRFRFTGYDLSPDALLAGHPQPYWLSMWINDTGV